MSGIVTIPNNSKIDRVSYHPSYSVICSIGKAPFHGVIDIVYQSQEALLEFKSFDKWLKSIALQSMTIEGLCRLVFDELSEALGDIPLSVTIHAETTVHAPASAQIIRGDFNE